MYALVVFTGDVGILADVIVVATFVGRQRDTAVHDDRLWRIEEPQLYPYVRSELGSRRARKGSRRTWRS